MPTPRPGTACGSRGWARGPPHHHRHDVTLRKGSKLWHQLLGGQRPSMGDCVRVPGPRGGRPLPEGASVAYPPATAR
jgi:hypothetical protein